MHHTIIKSALAALVLGGITSAARADMMWDWTYTTQNAIIGSAVSGDGTLTTDDLSGGTYTITSLTGTFNGLTITGFSQYPYTPPADQTLYTPGTALPDGSHTAQLSDAGLGFTTGSGFDTDPVNIGGISFSGVEYYSATDSRNYFDSQGTFTATEVVPAAAPEPEQMLSGLMVAGLGGASLLMRRFRNRK